VNISGDTVAIGDQATNGSYTVTVTVKDKDSNSTSQDLTINWTVVENGKDAIDYKIILTPNSVNITTNPNQPITGQIFRIEGSTQKDITGESLGANKVFFKHSGSGDPDEEKWYLLKTNRSSWVYPNCSNVEIAFCLNKIDDDDRFPYMDESGKLVGTEDLPAEYGETKYIYYYASATAIQDGNTPELPELFEYVPTYIYYWLSSADYDGSGLPTYPDLPDDGALPETTLANLGWQTQLPN
jgi:hypothetical protein